MKKEEWEKVLGREISEEEHETLERVTRRLRIRQREDRIIELFAKHGELFEEILEVERRYERINDAIYYIDLATHKLNNALIKIKAKDLAADITEDLIEMLEEAQDVVETIAELLDSEVIKAIAKREEEGEIKGSCKKEDEQNEDNSNKSKQEVHQVFDNRVQQRDRKSNNK